MIKAISNLDNNSKGMKASLTKQMKYAELPCTKKMNNVQNDSFTKHRGPVCGVDMSFED